MTGALLAQHNLVTLLLSPWVWGLALGALGLWAMLSGPTSNTRSLGRILGAASLVVLAISLPKLTPLTTWSQWGEQLVFWLLAGATVACSAAAITARNPLYTAIWFAGSLLGVAGLFLFQGAEFLGVATVVVYAGAIVVTFLFVLMLAKPDGHARYDRVSWSKFAVPIAVLAALALVVMVVLSFSPPKPSSTPHNVLAKDHMAQLGTELFARHLVAVEVAGTILLVSLVGAVAIVIHGKQSPGPATYSAEQNRVGGAPP